MTPDEIQAMVRGVTEGLGAAQWSVYLFAAIVAGASSFLGSYLSEKGKSKATKEDIQDLTRKVEEVKDEYVRQLEDLKAHHQLRLVAAERRLQAHQEAFERWLHLYNAVVREDDMETTSLVVGCQHWYAKNCVYLTSKSRDTFTKAYMSAIAHRQMKLAGNAEALAKNWATLEAAGNVFLSETLLPTLDAEGLRTAARAAGVE